MVNLTRQLDRATGYPGIQSNIILGVSERMVWDEINIQISRQNKRLAVLLSSTLREFFLPDGLRLEHQLIPDLRSTLKHQLFLGLKCANLQTEKIGSPGFQAIGLGLNYTTGSPASPVCSLTLWAF